MPICHGRGFGRGGWDTHNDNDKSMREDLMPPLDRALSALLEDLDQRGLLESTVILVTGGHRTSVQTEAATTGLNADRWFWAEAVSRAARSSVRVTREALMLPNAW